MDLNPGQMLGSYRIEERLVSGGMAKVYRARQASTGREVAIKALPTINADAAAIARFEREMRLLAGLQHPHILGLIDAGKEGTLHYLVLPLVRCGDLADLIAREDGPQTLAVARRVTLQLCEALDYAHAQGIVHRDLKPANVLLDERGNCLLTDFGIALPEGAERLTAAGHSIGTPEYFAPEQANGQADARSDLYALGIVLFQLVTGRMPFTARGAAEWLRAHREAPVPSPRSLNPALPAALDAVVQKALAKSPGARYQNAAEFAAAVRAALPDTAVADRSTAPTRETTVLRVPQAGPKSRAPLIAAAAAAAVLLIAAVAFLRSRTPASDTAATAPATTPATAAPAQAATRSAPPAAATAPDASVPAQAAPARLPAQAQQAAESDAIAPDENVYDRFDNPRFERRYDPSRWQATRAGATMRFEQHDGVLHVRSQEREHGLYAEFAGARLASVGARVRMAGPVAASQASIGISVSRLDHPGQWVSCYLYATRDAVTATPACTDQRRKEFRTGAAGALDEWHEVTLQIDGAARRVSFFADDQPLGELPFPASAGAGTWYVLLSGWSADGQPVEGDLAEIRIVREP